MPKIAKELGALAVSKLRHPGTSDKPVLRPVGGVAGLHLQLGPQPDDGTGSRSWILRVMVGERRRHIGLGSYPAISLARARELAAEAKQSARQGIDPIEQRRAAKATLAAEQARNLTFSEAVKRYGAIKLAELKSERGQDRWQTSIDRFAKPLIGNMRVGDIDIAAMLRVLQQPHRNERTGVEGELWSVTNESATMLRGWIEEILSWATVNGHRSGDNPARWSNNLDMTLPAPSKITTTVHYPAVSLADAPAFFAQLSGQTSTSGRALQFCMMTAVRSGNVRHAEWSEIDFDAKLWTIPASKMKVKTNGDHIVPLTDEAVKLLKGLDQTTDYIFPAKRGGVMSDMSLSMLMRDLHAAELKAGRAGWIDGQSGKSAVVHGLRSTFRDWAAEQTEYPADMAEIALAHKVGTEVQQAYRRGKMVQKRRQMMRDWDLFLRSR